MNSEIIKPTNGGELRELARKSPEDALFFLKKNLNIWNEIAIADPFDSADTLEEFERDQYSNGLKRCYSKKRFSVRVKIIVKPTSHPWCG